MNDSNNPQPAQQTTIIVKSQKSVGLAIVLSLLFGPLGMLYSTIMGAVIMFFVTLVIALFTAGFGAFFTWPICVIWAAVAASNHNNNL